MAKCVLLQLISSISLLCFSHCSCPGLVPAEGMRIQCHDFRPARGKRIPCNLEQLPSGTLAYFKCSAYYIQPVKQDPIFCLRDKWIGFDRFKKFHCEIDCGRPKTTRPNIMGGSLASPSKWPWHATIFAKYNEKMPFKYICGGSLIMIKGVGFGVVSAAHCFHDKMGEPLDDNPNVFKIILGSYSSSFEREIENPNAQTFNVKAIFLHDSFDSSSYENDMALVVLDHVDPVQLSPHVLPICLREDSSTYINENDVGFVVGFGSFSLNTKIQTASKSLRQAKFPVTKSVDCETWRLQDILPSEICAGFQTGPSTCSGDSGGGFVFRGRKKVHREREGIRHFIEGIVSHGAIDGCQDFGVFTRISYFINWIHNKSAEFVEIREYEAEMESEIPSTRLQSK